MFFDSCNVIACNITSVMFQVFKKDMAQDIPISGIIQLVFEILFWEVTFHDCFITLMRKKIVLILF